tara:strand:- start:596 stop:1465 length:870 start_codon:yes stop_codon:yes gene_type:complete
MISKVNEYENKITQTIYQEMLIKNKAKNILLQFNNFENIYLSGVYDQNISVPALNNLVKDTDISKKYKDVDNVFVFNQFEKKLFANKKNVNVLQIPIHANNNVITTKFDASIFKKFGYVSNLIQDQPILIDVVSSFYHATTWKPNIVLLLMIEGENSDVSNFKNNLYKDLGIPKEIQNKILWFSQGVLTDDVKIQFANSIDRLICCSIYNIDNYLMQYCLVNNKTIYSQYQYFDKVNLIESHLRFVYNDSSLVSYLSPNLDNLIQIFERDKVSTDKTVNYTNTGIMEYV